jgi:hypothetical protein
MPHFYIDDSIQDRGDFVVGALVFGPDAEASVSAAIQKTGLKPEVDEFKSSARMSEHPEQVRLRYELRGVLDNYRVGVLVIPRQERSKLGHYALQAVDQFVNTNRLQKADLRVFLDEGMFASAAAASQSAAAIGIDQYCQVLAEQNSKRIKGLQLADLAAHTAGLMLLDSLGLLKKMVEAGPDSGYQTDTEIELGFRSVGQPAASVLQRRSGAGPRRGVQGSSL